MVNGDTMSIFTIKLYNFHLQRNGNRYPHLQSLVSAFIRRRVAFVFQSGTGAVALLRTGFCKIPENNLKTRDIRRKGNFTNPLRFDILRLSVRRWREKRGFGK